MGKRHLHLEPFQCPSRRHELVLYALGMLIGAGVLVVTFFAGFSAGVAFHG